MSGGQAHEESEIVLLVDGTMKVRGREVTRWGLYRCDYDQEKGHHNLSKKAIATGTLDEMKAAKDEMADLL